MLTLNTCNCSLCLGFPFVPQFMLDGILFLLLPNQLCPSNEEIIWLMFMCGECEQRVCCNCSGFRKLRRIICSRWDFLLIPTWRRGVRVILLSLRLPRSAYFASLASVVFGLFFIFYLSVFVFAVFNFQLWSCAAV